MTTVIGIDPSLRSTGLARLTCHNDQWVSETWTRPSQGRRRDGLSERHDRVCGIAADVLAYTEPCDLACIEEPAFGAPGGSTWDRAYLWWRIVGRLLDHDVPVVVVNSATRRKFTTGSAGPSADKAMVAARLARMWPDWEPDGSDAADALAIASVGACALDLPVPFDVTEYRRDALGAVNLPTDKPGYQTEHPPRHWAIHVGQVWSTHDSRLPTRRHARVTKTDDDVNEPDTYGRRVTVVNTRTGRVSHLQAATLRECWELELEIADA